MYKCGRNGCEKAYGTLNHLNAHVTMQSHGQKPHPRKELWPLFHDILIREKPAALRSITGPGRRSQDQVTG